MDKKTLSQDEINYFLNNWTLFSLKRIEQYLYKYEFPEDILTDLWRHSALRKGLILDSHKLSDEFMAINKVDEYLEYLFSTFHFREESLLYYEKYIWYHLQTICCYQKLTIKVIKRIKDKSVMKYLRFNPYINGKLIFRILKEKSTHKQN